LHLKLGFNEVLPGLAQLDVLGCNLQRFQDGHGSMGLEHRAMIGDDALRAPIGGEGGKEQLQERGQIWMFGGHPRQNRAGVACQNTEAIDPAPLDFDEIANSHTPEMMSIGRAIGQVSRLERGFLLVSGTGPRTRRPMHAPIDGHGPPARGCTGEVGTILLFEEPMQAKTSRTRVLLLQVQHVFEKWACPLVVGMRGGRVRWSSHPHQAKPTQEAPMAL